MGRKHAKKNGNDAVAVDPEDAALFRGQLEMHKKKGDELFAQSQCAPSPKLCHVICSWRPELCSRAVLRPCSMQLTQHASCRLMEALVAYERALSFSPCKSSERALLHSNRAACFIREALTRS